MEFIVLDSNRMSHIASALGKDCTVIPLSTGAAIRQAAKQNGWPKTLGRLAKCFTERPVGISYDLVANNILRKSIRFPAAKYFGPIFYLYRRIKKLECMVYTDAIQTALDNNPQATALIFNGTMMPESILAELTKTKPRLFLENGYFPDTLQIDPDGINYNNTVPQNPDFYLSYTPKPDQPVPTSIGIRKAKVKYDTTQILPDTYIFVPFQVPSDMQITELSPWISDMMAFYSVLQKAADAAPDKHFVIKEHPSFRRSIIGKVPSHPRITFANGVPTPDLIANSEAVVTINSTVGIEALVLDKKVITLGLSIYNMDGLVQHCENPAQFNQAISALETWQTDTVLRQRFLQYLFHDYLIDGTFIDVPENIGQLFKGKVKDDFFET